MFEASYIIQFDTLIQHGIPKKGAISFLEKLEESGMPYVIITEQSGRFRDHIADYLIERGFRYVRPSRIYTSSMACVDYVHVRYPKMNKAGYLGGAGMKEALEKAGYTITFDHPDFVIVGMNKKSNYFEYSRIAHCVKEGALLISSDERRSQLVDGVSMIGNGAIVRMIEYATNKKSIKFARGCDNFLLMTKLFLNKENIMLVGNDLKKDIASGMRCKFTTVYVTEGRDLSKIDMDETMHPDYIVEDLFGLTK